MYSRKVNINRAASLHLNAALLRPASRTGGRRRAAPRLHPLRRLRRLRCRCRLRRHPRVAERRDLDGDLWPLVPSGLTRSNILCFSPDARFSPQRGGPTGVGQDASGLRRCHKPSWRSGAQQPVKHLESPSPFRTWANGSSSPWGHCNVVECLLFLC